jgi:hypothetical protein
LRFRRSVGFFDIVLFAAIASSMCNVSLFRSRCFIGVDLATARSEINHSLVRESIRGVIREITTNDPTTRELFAIRLRARTA